MKKILLFCLSLSFLASCSEAPKSAEAADSQPGTSDSAAIAETIHGFYKWYESFSMDTLRSISFLDNTGEHFKLDPQKMDTYFGHFKSSGFVSDEFVKNEYDFYKKCEGLWQNESMDDVPSCLDADKYFCGQDYDIKFYVDTPVRIRPDGQDRVIATLSGNEWDSTREMDFRLKKEGGKWLLVEIECDMGVE